MMRAHPRSRGENLREGVEGFHEEGSSPLTRGKPDGLQAAKPVVGLIPAHAGKTLSACRRANRRWAHPRSRGENVVTQVPVGTPPGSSPLTRGKRCGGVHSRIPGGLIPAHAGKTSELVDRRTSSRAHPRSRGENQVNLVLDDGQAGSSPLTRGKLTTSSPAGITGGLIPAHAGRTDLCRADGEVTEAHPRSRGENICPRCLTDRQEGSSPLTRGKQSHNEEDRGERGLIPAHAGKT